MKIAIVGGGWVGCHLANKLSNHDVTIFDKNKELFSETSYNNQNRLHLGFHYARNYKTRILCRSTFGRFLKNYDFLTKVIPKNLYCVPLNESVIDFGTFKEIFRDIYFKETKEDFGIKNIEGSIFVEERYIDFDLAKDYFNNRFSHIQREVTDLEELSKEYDLVINCTNNHIVDPDCKDPYFFEKTLVLVYKKKAPFPVDAITLVDGDLFSIYPYKDDLYTLTDVHNCPLATFTNIQDLNQFVVTEEMVYNNIQLATEKVKKYIPTFNEVFEYHSYFVSTKSKIKNKTADRYPYISKRDNVVHCFTGKIQGIYVISDYIIHEIIDR